MKHLLNELRIMKRIICILFVLLHCCLNVSAQSADKAQKQYMQKDYVGAIATYEKLLADTAAMQGNIRVKANVYYNLANCYYRTICVNYKIGTFPFYRPFAPCIIAITKLNFHTLCTNYFSIFIS